MVFHEAVPGHHLEIGATRVAPNDGYPAKGLPAGPVESAVIRAIPHATRKAAAANSPGWVAMPSWSSPCQDSNSPAWLRR